MENDNQITGNDPYRYWFRTNTILFTVNLTNIILENIKKI